jgi:peptide/nickel transport system substrate-binding protein
VLAVNTAYNLVPQAKAAGYKVVEDSPPYVLGLFLNMSKAPFNDPVARQALAYAIDRKRLNSTVNSGLAPPPTHLLNSSSPFYDAAAKLPQYNQKKAQQLFDQYKAVHGQPMTFAFEAAAGATQSIGDFLQAQLSQFNNVSMTETVVPGQQTLTDAIAGNFQAFVLGISLFDPEPDISSEFTTGSQRNYSRYSDPAMDAAIMVGRTSLSVAKRAAAYKTVQSLLIRDEPFVHLELQPFDYIMSSKVVNLKYLTGYQIDWAQVQVKS